MPTFGIPEDCAVAPIESSSADAAAIASTRPTRALLIIVAFLPRDVLSPLDIGLTHDGLDWKRGRGVHADLGHHPALPGEPHVRKLPPVAVLEVVDVVWATAIPARGPSAVVGRRVDA